MKLDLPKGAPLLLGTSEPGWSLGVWSGTTGDGTVYHTAPPPPPYTGSEPVLALLKQEAAKTVKVYHKSGSDDHGTPQGLFDVLDQEFHLTLDVCATASHEVPDWHPAGEAAYGGYMQNTPVLDPGNAKCPIYFTKDDDGLAQAWFGRVFMNPPYTKSQIGVWVSKLVQELVDGHIELAVALVAARPDTKWFGKIATYASEIRFLKGRLTFEPNQWAAPFPSAVCIFDPTKIGQRIVFWDWQKGLANVYWHQALHAGFPEPLLPTIWVPDAGDQG